MYTEDTILSFIACLNNKQIRDELNKHGCLKLQRLDNLNVYLQDEKLKLRTVTETNFSNCIIFVEKYLSNKEFIKYLEKNNICIVSYEKENIHKNQDDIENTLKYHL